MKKRRGFTLIEILVVLAIIGVIIAFMLPNFLGTQDRAKEGSVKAILHSVQLAIEAYNMENEIYPIGTNVPLKSLYDNYLAPGGYLSSLPKNPFTGQPYTDQDIPGKIVYNYDQNSGKYTLTGYKRNGTTKLLELQNS